MRDYGKVAPTFWTGETGKAIKRRGSEAVIVACYLMSSPHSNMLGLFYQPALYMAHETGLGIEGATKGLQGCIEAHFCRYDEQTEMVWVIEMAKWQIAEALKPSDLRCAGVQKEYNALPNNPFLVAFFDRYMVAFHMASRRAFTPPGSTHSKAPSKPLPSQEQEQEQEKEQEKPPIPPKGGDSDSSPESAAKPKRKRKAPPVITNELAELFELWYRPFPRKEARAKAFEAFVRLNPDRETVQQWIAAIEAQGLAAKVKRDGSAKFIPLPASWLNGKRWEDEAGPGTDRNLFNGIEIIGTAQGRDPLGNGVSL